MQVSTQVPPLRRQRHPVWHVPQISYDLSVCAVRQDCLNTVGEQAVGAALEQLRAV